MAASNVKNVFKQNHTEHVRKSESSRMKAKYEERVPVVVQLHQPLATDANDCDKFLVPKDLSLGQFLTVLRKRKHLRAEQSIYIIVNNMVPPSTMLMGTIYDNHADEDGFLYVFYAFENTFGGGVAV